MLTMHDFLGYDQSDDITPVKDTAGLEMYNYRRFQYNFHIWRMSFLGSRILSITPDTQLPWDSVYHTFDNVQTGLQSDVPKVADDPFIRNERYYKWIVHILEPRLDQPINIDDKYVLPLARLKPNLMAFRSAQRNAFRYPTGLEGIPTKREAFTVVNYNPLFRLYNTGVLKLYRKYNIILATVLNTIYQIYLQQPNKYHYIHIPWTQAVHTRDQFMRSKSKLNPSTILYPDSFHYVFMMHFLNWLDGSKTSLFKDFPETCWENTSFLLTLNDKMTILNLADLRAMNEKNRAYFKVVNHLNMLATSQLTTTNTLTESSDSTGPDDTILRSIVKRASDTATPTTSTSEITVPDNSSVPDIPDTATVVPVKTPSIAEAVSAPVTTSDTTVKTETKPVEVTVPIIKDKTPVIDTKKAIARKIRPIQAKTKRILHPDTQEEIDVPVPTPLVPEIPANITEVVPITDVPTNQQRAKVRMAELDEATKKYIQNRLDLTPAQKERLIGLSTKYKQLTLDGERLEDILLGNNDTTISDQVIPEIQELLPDKTMAHSSVMSMDKSYQQKTATKDLVNIFTGFAKQGMLLVGIQTKSISDELNHLREYTLTYESPEGRKTLKMTVAVPSPDGTFLMNGVKKVLKKQLINLPIVKISEVKVSMASCFNKVLVLRNITKAHSFITQIDRILQLSGNLVQFVYGSANLNLPLAYEYTTIAQKYQQIVLDKSKQMVRATWDGPKILFSFDYANRYQAIASDPSQINKLMALEKHYGVLIGRHSSIAYYFMDVNNQVTRVRITDGVVLNFKYERSLVDIFKAYLPNEISKKIGFITEWTDLNLVSKPLPVGFVLAFRYGLTNILNYLKVPFKLIAKRGNKIVEDSQTAYAPEDMILGEIGTEDYQYFNQFLDQPGFDIIPANEALFSKQMLEEHRDAVGTDIDSEGLAILRNGNTVDKYEYQPNDIVIKFNDVNLVINRYPLANSLIICGISQFNTEYHDFEEFDTPDVYNTLLREKNINPNYLKAVTNFFDLFVDDITRDVLEQMHEPTNVRDLLIRATVLLTTTDHKEASSMANHRVRGYEQINAIIYNEMARQLANYRARGGRGVDFSLNPEAVYLRILQNPAFLLMEETNPVQCIKDMSGATYAGIGGRSSDSFVLEDRKFPKDGLGILSEATVDNGKVAMNVTLPMNAQIANTRGILTPKSVDEQNPTNLFNVTTLLMPGALNDDSVF